MFIMAGRFLAPLKVLIGILSNRKGGNRKTYTKQVREYCLNNQGTVLDVSLMKDCEFSEIPYKTLLKILKAIVVRGLRCRDFRQSR